MSVLEIRDENGNFVPVLCLKGDDGKDGVDGKDGYSIEGIVFPEDNYDDDGNLVSTDYTVMIGCEEGYREEQITVYHGKDGKTPVKGTDYFTAADKADMVAAVIDALPNGNEVAY